MPKITVQGGASYEVTPPGLDIGLTTTFLRKDGVYAAVPQSANNLSDVPAPAAALANLGGLGLVAATAVGGYALVNGTGTIISWTAPNDGKLHRFTIMTALSITVAETGGNIIASWFTPDGANPSATIYFGGTGASQPQPATWFQTVVKPGSVVAVNQSTALTAGTATLWAEIWAL